MVESCMVAINMVVRRLAESNMGEQYGRAPHGGAMWSRAIWQSTVWQRAVWLIADGKRAMW